MAEMTALLIAGSRYINAAGIAYAEKAVRRAHELGWTVVVGDNPKGIDRAVIDECSRLKAKFVVVAANETRYTGSAEVRPEGLFEIEGGSVVVHQNVSYAQRDQIMVTLAHKSLFIWNGESKGTKAGYDFAVELIQKYGAEQAERVGKETWLKTFK